MICGDSGGAAASDYRRFIITFTAVFACPGTKKAHHTPGMSNGRKRLAFAGIALIAAGTLYALFLPAEPEYQGHLLSEWLGPAQGEDKTQPTFAPAEAEVSDAIRSTYPRNLHFLVEWIGSDQDRTSRMLWALPRWVRWFSKFERIDTNLDFLNYRAQAAADAFNVLGSAGAPAIPQLATILRQGAEDPANRAARALSSIGERALPAILATAALKECTNRWQAVAALARFTNNTAVCQFLTNALKDPEPHVRQAASDALSGNTL
jgi:hypothetical protein